MPKRRALGPPPSVPARDVFDASVPGIRITSCLRRGIKFAANPECTLGMNYRGATRRPISEGKAMIGVMNQMRSNRKADENHLRILQRVRNRLAHHCLFQGRTHLIDVDENDGRLLITGKLPSIYLKQALQTAVRDIEGVQDIDNRVDVIWPGN